MVAQAAAEHTPTADKSQPNADVTQEVRGKDPTYGAKVEVKHSSLEYYSLTTYKMK